MTVLVRAPVIRVVDHGDSTTVLGASATRRFDGDTAELVRVVLELHARPLARDALLAALADRAGEPVPEAPIDQLLALLVEDGVLVAPRAQPRPALSRRVVVAISGAVAAVDAPLLVRGLHAIGCDVRIALTRNARKFVAPAALDALVHHQVWSSLWQRDARVPVPHVALAEWAELVIVYPASATTIARLATGDASELVSALVVATRAPVVIAPSMNEAMYTSPAVQANLAALRAHGRWVVHPASGVEVAHAPGARAPQVGPAPPAAVMIDIARHVLQQLPPRLPDDARGWERLWATTPADQLPWHADAPVPGLAEALGDGAGRTLVDLGCGDGTVAIAAARRGFAVTAVDVAPSALGRARERAGELPIVFVLDDCAAPRIAGPFDVAVDCGLLHVLPRERWPAYAAAVTRLAPARLFVVAHDTAIAADELRGLLPAFTLARATATTLARAPAQLFALVRS
jgi:SAM-dependent methyltransferase/3-polyprenyl-4-hydroxybenzoate decarboxylase